MALGYRGIGLLVSFLVVDAALILIVNAPTVETRTGASASTGDQLVITMALAGAAVIAILAGIFFRFKPVPATKVR